jgi:hypothetical protein
VHLRFRLSARQGTAATPGEREAAWVRGSEEVRGRPVVAALFVPRLRQRRNQNVAEDCKIAVEIGVWPLLARHDLGDEVARCRIEDLREGHDTSITREDGTVRDLELLGQALEGLDKSDCPVAIVFAHAGQQLPPSGVCPDVPGFFNAGPYSQTDVYTGGTGRFANATGNTVSVGCLYFGAEISPGVYTFYATFSETGTLTY